jgi:hypothetical protein
VRRGHRPDALIAAVQTNCHIADARHAADLSLCVYLLQMRELFRWEQRLAFGATLDREAVGKWLAQRERHWSRIEAQAWRALPIGEREFDAHDVEAVNAELAPLGLIYGAGLAGAGRPTCFLAHLHERQRREQGVLLQVCGRELARGLFAPAAALAGGHTIVLRRESLARALWEKFEFFSVRRVDGPFKALLEACGVSESAGFVAALPRLVDKLSECLVLHELGEHRAAQWLEPGWAAMRLALQHRRTDLQVRAVRDHLADLEVTLPALIERDDAAALHFWFANYEGLREQLFPTLTQAWRAWRAGDGWRLLLHLVHEGAAHFRVLAGQVLLLHQQLGGQAGPAIGRLLSAPLAVCAVPPMRVSTSGV